MPDTDELVVLKAAGTLAAGATVLDRFIANFTGDIADVKAVVGTAPTGAALIVDIQKNGTSIYADALATVAGAGATAQGSSGTGVTSSATQVVVSPSNPGTGAASVGGATSALPVEKGDLIKIDTEQMLVTDIGGAYSGTQVAGEGNETLTVTRAQNGTSAAAHNAGASVLPVPPTIAVSTTKSIGSSNGGMSGRKIAQGDVLTLVVTQVGSTVAGADLEVSITVNKD